MNRPAPLVEKFRFAQESVVRNEHLMRSVRDHMNRSFFRIVILLAAIFAYGTSSVALAGPGDWATQEEPVTHASVALSCATAPEHIKEGSPTLNSAIEIFDILRIRSRLSNSVEFFPDATKDQFFSEYALALHNMQLELANSVLCRASLNEIQFSGAAGEWLWDSGVSIFRPKGPNVHFTIQTIDCLDPCFPVEEGLGNHGPVGGVLDGLSYETHLPACGPGDRGKGSLCRESAGGGTGGDLCEKGDPDC